MIANILILCSVCLSVAGQFLMKKGMSSLGIVSLSPELIRAMFQPYVFAGLCLYAISAVIWLSILSRVDLSYAYPMLSIGYVLVLLVSWMFLNEQVTYIRMAGVLFIGIGVVLVSRS